jgi:hypothetical protein
MATLDANTWRLQGGAKTRVRGDKSLVRARRLEQLGEYIYPSQIAKRIQQGPGYTMRSKPNTQTLVAQPLSPTYSEFGVQ